MWRRIPLVRRELKGKRVGSKSRDEKRKRRRSDRPENHRSAEEGEESFGDRPETPRMGATSPRCTVSSVKCGRAEWSERSGSCFLAPGRLLRREARTRSAGGSEPIPRPRTLVLGIESEHKRESLNHHLAEITPPPAAGVARRQRAGCRLSRWPAGSVPGTTGGSGREAGA